MKLIIFYILLLSFKCTKNIFARVRDNYRTCKFRRNVDLKKKMRIERDESSIPARQPIALSASKRQFKEIAGDFSPAERSMRLFLSLSFRFRSKRLLEKCPRRVPLVLGLSADVKN